MSVTFVTLLIGVLNLCLGYALAVRLGYGPPSLVDAWEVLTAGRPSQPAPPVKDEAPAESASAMPEEEIGPTLEELLDEPYEEAYAPYDDEFDAPYDDEFDAPYDEAENSPLDESPELDGPDDWELDERFVEVSILKLNIAMIRSGTRTTEIDSRLRAVRGRSARETIQACRDRLLEDCRAFLEEHSKAADRFRERIDELGELRSLGDQIEMDNLEQAAQVETTINNLEYMDFESDLEAANARLVEELKNLRMARHKLRDDQEKAFLAIARYENRVDKMEKRLFHDPLTKLLNRIGLEATLWQGWQEGRHESGSTSAAMFDLDAFGVVNEEYGCLVCDKILYRIAQYLQQQAGEADLVGRFGGQRFVWVAVGVGPRQAVKGFELMRQSIERITFLSGGDEIRVTVRGGITEVADDDTDEAVLGRLQQALAKAKEVGPNRSFLWEGERLQAVDSPSFGADYVEIAI